jgi:trimeric autotransporter adhesin
VSSFVGGGTNNKARGAHSVVCGGGEWPADSNSAAGDYSFVGGGIHNRAAGDTSVIGGGNTNSTWAASSTIAGGANNQVTGEKAAVGGGDQNVAAGENSVIGGGHYNMAWADYSVISGGWVNETSGSYNTIGGGDFNEATGFNSTVGGGGYNKATGTLSTIPGGMSNIAAGAYSLAAGRRSHANGDGVFAWADATGDTFSIGASNTFNARAAGGVRFWTTSDYTQNIGARLPAGGSSWTTLSDSTKKQNIRLVDTKDVLNRVAQLPIKQWSYKSQDPSIEHIGPMAQDFYRLFSLGDDPLTISTIDPSGIALAAIQALNAKNEILERELIELRAELQSLKKGQ